MAKTLTTVVLVAIAASVSAHATDPRTARCLLEVNGVHYIGGVCRFIPTDERGSFRISDVRGFGIVAQVIITKEGEGAASWNGPIGGNAPGKELGTSYHVEGCWLVEGSKEQAKICAWDLHERVSVEPTPTEDINNKNVVYWGNRVGMYDDIVSREGLDTERAIIKTAPSRKGAITFCREYGRDYSLKCIEGTLREERPKGRVITANCRTGEFTDFEGEKFKFLGRGDDKKDEYGAYAEAKYRIMGISGGLAGEVLSDSMASGYYIEAGIFKALCPSSIPDEIGDR